MSVKLIKGPINANVPIVGDGSKGKIIADPNGQTLQFGEFGETDSIALTNDDGAFLAEGIYMSSTIFQLFQSGTVVFQATPTVTSITDNGTLLQINPTSKLGFFLSAGAVKQTAVPVTAAGIHAALVAYGMIT